MASAKRSGKKRSRLSLAALAKSSGNMVRMRSAWTSLPRRPNKVCNSSRYCQSPATAGLFRTVGYGGDSGSIEDIAISKLVLIVGSNTAESHPVLATRVKRAHKLFGQRLIVADPREHEMATRADIHFRPKPGSDLVWLCAFSRYMFDHGYAKTEFIAQHVNNLDEYRKSLEPFTMEFAASQCGV